MNILVIHGPNLNMLGSRNPHLYGTTTLSDICAMLTQSAEQMDIDLTFFQSNHEGALIDFLQMPSSRRAHGVLINPGALTHYGYALRDALEDIALPIVEVHLSDITKREPFRRTRVLEGVTKTCIMGQREQGYIIAFEKLMKEIRS